MNTCSRDRNTFRDNKAVALKASKELLYSEEIIEMIKKATTKEEILKAMEKGRHSIKNYAV